MSFTGWAGRLVVFAAGASEAGSAAGAGAGGAAGCAGAVPLGRGGLGLDELELETRMAELGQLGLQQSVVARIVHQPDVVLEFGVEADGE